MDKKDKPKFNLSKRDKEKLLMLAWNVISFVIVFPFALVYYAMKGQSKGRRRR